MRSLFADRALPFLKGRFEGLNMASVTGRGEWARRALALVLALVLSGASVVSQESPTDYTFRSTSELVLVNVTARDKTAIQSEISSARTSPFSKTTARSR